MKGFAPNAYITLCTISVGDAGLSPSVTGAGDDEREPSHREARPAALPFR